MLKVKLSHIPPEGKDVDEPLDVEQVHLETEEGFALVEGGRLFGRIDKGDDESVQLRARLTAGLRMQCGRCLETFDYPVDQDLDLFFLPHKAGPDPEEEEDVALADRDMVVTYYEKDTLDLGEMVREQFYLTLPMRRVCGEDCKGLCATCGINRNTADCQCPEDVGDPRLSPLKRLFEKGSS